MNEATALSVAWDPVGTILDVELEHNAKPRSSNGKYERQRTSVKKMDKVGKRRDSPKARTVGQRYLGFSSQNLLALKAARAGNIGSSIPNSTLANLSTDFCRHKFFYSGPLLRGLYLR